MKFQIGDIVRFNSNDIDGDWNGYLAIITHINSQMPYLYTVRTILSPCLEHLCGDIKEDWVEKT